MKDLILNIWNAYTLIDVVLIYLFVMLSLFYFLRLKQAKKKVKNYSFFSTCSAETIEDYENQIKLQECQIEDRKKYFEDAVAEITELRATNNRLKDTITGLLNDENNIITELKEDIRIKDKTIEELVLNRDYWKERALHQKHSKQVESEYWEYIGFKYNPYSPIDFENGNKYKFLHAAADGIFYLKNEQGEERLVERKYFKPVIK